MNVLARRIKAQGITQDARILEAFTKIRRSDFIPRRTRRSAQSHEPLSIGFRQYNSSPLMVAQMLELLDVRQGHRVLDVGSGSGWTTVLLAELVGSSGNVYALEIIPKLKEIGERNAEKYGFVSSGRATFFCHNARTGFPAYAPFDRIIVSAASRDVPRKLLCDLSAPGKMVIPLGDPCDDQILTLVTKDTREDVKRHPHEDCVVFVPLVRSR